MYWGAHVCKSEDNDGAGIKKYPAVGSMDVRVHLYSRVSIFYSPRSSTTICSAHFVALA